MNDKTFEAVIADIGGRIMDGFEMAERIGRVKSAISVLSLGMGTVVLVSKISELPEYEVTYINQLTSANKNTEEISCIFEDLYENAEECKRLFGKYINVSRMWC